MRFLATSLVQTQTHRALLDALLNLSSQLRNKRMPPPYRGKEKKLGIFTYAFRRLSPLERQKILILQ